jgi:hypothetical protein
LSAAKNGVAKGSPRVLPKGKNSVTWLLPDKIIVQIGIKAVRERKRQSAIAERLLMKGLEAESRGAKRAPSEETDVA